MISLLALVSSASATVTPVPIIQKALHPNASFTISPSKWCTGSGYYYPDEQIDFTDRSTSGFYPIVSWYWDFGDGYSSSLQNPVHTYYTQGQKYTVTLKVTNQLGFTSTATKQIVTSYYIN